MAKEIGVVIVIRSPTFSRSRGSEQPGFDRSLSNDEVSQLLANQYIIIKLKMLIVAEDG